MLQISLIADSAQESYLLWEWQPPSFPASSGEKSGVHPEVDSAELPSLTLPSSLSIITLFKMRGREQWGDKENICVRKLHFKRQLKTGINKSAFMEAFLHVVKHF